MRDGGAAARAHVDLAGASGGVQAAKAAHFVGVEDLFERLVVQITDGRAIQHVTLAAGEHAAVLLHVHGPAPQVVTRASTGALAPSFGLHQVGLVFLYANLIDTFRGARETAKPVYFLRTAPAPDH